MTRRVWPQWVPAMFLVLLCLATSLLALRDPGDMQATDRTGASEFPAQDDPPLPTQDAAAPTYSPPPQSDFDIVVARNLFDVSRQPPPDNDTADDTRSAQSKDFALEGVLRSPTRSVAILLDKRASETVQVTLGEAYGGWTLDSVENGHVILSRASEELRLDLPSLIKGDAGSGLTVNGVPQARPLAVQPRRGDTEGNPVRARRQPLARQTVQPDS